MNRRSNGRWVCLLLVALGVSLALPIGCGPTDGAPASRTETLSPEIAEQRGREALAIRDPLARSLAWGSVLERSGSDALDPLRNVLEVSQLDAGEPEVVLFAMWWARRNPEHAFAWASSDWRGTSWTVTAAVFRVWGHVEPGQAFARLGAVSNVFIDAAISGLIAGWLESGKPGVVEQVEAIPDEALRQKVGESLARRIVLTRGAEGAIQWLDQISAPAFRTVMAKRIASAAAEQGHGATVAAWAEQRVTSGDTRPSGYPRRIATRWVLRDPEAAMAWLASLPPGKDRDDGVAEAFRDWHRFAPGAALVWIRKTELARWAEPAFGLHARQLAQQRPEQALELVARFSDPVERDRITALITREWAARDPEAASAWLANRSREKASESAAPDSGS